jgi:hypothetical protein
MTEKIAFRVQLPPPEELPKPEAANFFYFTFVGPDVQLLVGYIDFRVFHDASKNKEVLTASPQVYHRFLIPQTGFDQFKLQVDEIADKYEKAKKKDNKDA